MHLGAKMRAVLFALAVIFLVQDRGAAAEISQDGIFSKEFIAFFFEIRRYNNFTSEPSAETANQPDGARPPSGAEARSVFDVCDDYDLDKLRYYILNRDRKYIDRFNLASDPDDLTYRDYSISYVKRIISRINKLTHQKVRKGGAAIAYIRLDTEGVIVEARVTDFLGDPAAVKEAYAVVTPGRKLGEPPSFVDRDSLRFTVPIVFVQ
ncbi:hypothetical protein M446_0121 [Methylobacterium sp. 4-46]|nr:hypothetical protein M446_0121 [Methylobacterium sp. 4-46]